MATFHIEDNQTSQSTLNSPTGKESRRKSRGMQSVEQVQWHLITLDLIPIRRPSAGMVALGVEKPRRVVLLREGPVADHARNQSSLHSHRHRDRLPTYGYRLLTSR